jgi:lipase maturation factor 1
LGPLHFSLLQPRDQTFRLTESFFLRLLGVVYLIAFASLWSQILGLIGANGISPATETIAAMHADYGWHAYVYVPSLFWLSPSNGTLQAICASGCGVALLLIAGIWVRSAAFASYTLYLSLVTVGQPFTSFQWDALLLEAGFLAIFAGASLLPFAYRFLLFRLMFESGLVKLTSGDQNWRNLHALRYHFFTQPLPNPLAYYLYQAPGWLLDGLTLITLLIELIVPFLLFVPARRVRHVAVVLLISLQLFIALTGNYAFFNLLTVTLCLWSLDDETLSRLPKWRLPSPLRFHRTANWSIAIVVALSVLQIFALEPSFLQSFEIVNPYGLFADMTTSRIELVIEGSNDKIHWLPYSFRFKPGDVKRELPIVAPLQPRLDWQMWFAALGGPEGNAWTRTLVYRLLMGQPEVLDLLEASPFSAPPRFICIRAYSYNFSSFAERRKNGVIWQRKLLGNWFGPVSIDLPK